MTGTTAGTTEHSEAVSVAEARTAEDLLRQQESLRAVIESISSELELRPLLTRIVRHACDLLHAEHGSIGLVDEEREVVRTEAVFHMPPGELGAEMPAGVGLAGQVFATRRPVLLNRYGDVERPLYEDSLEDAVIGIPILWRERMIGFFGIGSSPPRCFTDSDAEVLSLFARHAAIAIENARRYEREQRRTERLALIARIGQIIAADLEPSDLLQRAADAIHELLGYPYISIALAEDEGRLLQFAAVAGGEHSTAATRSVHIPQGQGIVGAAAETRRAVLVRNVHADPRYLPTPGTEGIRSELAVPILHGDRLLGVLNAESDGTLTEDDRTSLQIIADQLAVALENARLYAAARRTLAETEALYRTSRRIGTAMDVDEVVHAYLEQVAERAPYACSVALYEFDEDGQRSAVVARGRWSPDAGIQLTEERLPYSRDALDAPLDAGLTVTIRDVRTDPRVSPELKDIQKRSGRPALALIPLLTRGQRIGVVALSSPQVQDWPEDEIQPYQASAAQLATAIESRRQHLLLFERSQRIAILEERQRLARDLHDSVTQLLFSMNLIAQSLSGAWHRDPAEGERRVARLLELSRAAFAEMRALLSEWRPSAQEGAAREMPSIFLVRKEGLVSALRHHIETATAGTEGLEIRLEAKDYQGQVPEKEEALFRIVQEALGNAVKHANARNVEVRLMIKRDGAVHLGVQDDGKGFERDADDGSASGRKAGMGLTTMRERAEAQGGTIHLRSTPGKGTIIEVRLPGTKEGEKQ